jgi:hypothetical protein
VGKKIAQDSNIPDFVDSTVVIKQFNIYVSIIVCKVFLSHGPWCCIQYIAPPKNLNELFDICLSSCGVEYVTVDVDGRYGVRMLGFMASFF